MSEQSVQRPSYWTDVPTPVRVIACAVTWAVLLVGTMKLATLRGWPVLTGWGLAHGSIIVVGPVLGAVLWLAAGTRMSQLGTAVLLGIAALLLYLAKLAEPAAWVGLCALLFVALRVTSYTVRASGEAPS